MLNWDLDWNKILYDSKTYRSEIHLESLTKGEKLMAEAYEAAFSIENISPDECYQKAMEVATKVMVDFNLWKKRPIARLFGMQKKDDEFSTINFFLVTKDNDIEIQVRFNTRDISIGDLETMFNAFKNEMIINI